MLRSAMPERARSPHRTRQASTTDLVPPGSVIVDEERERFSDGLEAVRRLIHRAKLDLPGEKERRRQDVWDDLLGLAERLRERQELHAAANQGDEVRNDGPEASSERGSLRTFAAEQRDLFGIFAQTCERKPEIGLHVLALEEQVDQRASDEMADHRSGGRRSARPRTAIRVLMSVPGSAKFLRNAHSTIEKDTSVDTVEISRME